MREREYSICQAEVPANASRAAAHPAHELIPVNLVACLLAGGVPAQDAAWTSDAAFLHITAYCLEASVAEQQGEDVRGEVVDRAEIEERLKMLPVEQFPSTVASARELTVGDGHDRFDYTLRLMMRGLSAR